MKFDSVFFSPDLFIAMDEYSDCFTLLSKDTCSLFGATILMEKHLPLNSAVFVNHIGEIVGIYSDGKLVEVPLDSAINYLAKYPTAIKKKPLLD